MVYLHVLKSNIYNRMKNLVSTLIVFLFTFSAYSQTNYEKELFISSKGDSLLYRLLRPTKVDDGKKYPLILFLHGAGERGNDNQKQLTHGAQMFLNPVNQEKYPAYVLMPQCPIKDYWAYTERPKSFVPLEMPLNPTISPLFQTVKELLDKYINSKEIDKKRVYIIGLSMGGMGTYDLVARFPEVFAAAIPICGTVNPNRLKAAKKVHFRIFHGDADSVVPVEGSREAYKALKSVGAKVEYIEFPSCNHGSWVPAFNSPDFLKWLFKQKK